ncbi:YggS family pyridoxal phosphate-dependent enzyme [Candidatus Poribacteria bacterium]|nr:YggS family pyridoxal phosphate-dependent enzyme [Candidatus Poribacteria bacterium]
MSEIKANIIKIRERIAQAAKRSGREPESIQLVAVSKTVPVEKIIEAVDAGITDIGENRVQEADQKYQAIYKDEAISLLCKPMKWHLVGHLQTNKIKRALEIFDMIHSVDSIHLMDAIEKRAAQMDKVVDVLVEVNTSAEETKYGVKPEEIVDFMERASQYDHLRVRGLMTIGLFAKDPEVVRPCFQQLRELRDKVANLNLPSIEMKYLSMGMTNDFEVAIEEGANIVRIGTAIFGPRT